MTTPLTRTRTMKIRMMVWVMMMGMLGMVTAQDNPWPPPPERSCIAKLVDGTLGLVKQAQENSHNELYCVDVFPKYHQLWITDEEAEDICKAANASAMVKSGLGGAWAPHPRCCFAHLVCSGSMYNPKKVNTIYRFRVQVAVLSRGEYFDPVTHRGAYWSTTNNCAADPCNTRRGMPDALMCQKYWTCDQTDGKKKHVENNCPARQSFSYTLDRCVDDPMCNPTGRRTENVRCVKAAPVPGRPMIPGLTERSYYNRTYRFLDTQVEVTVQEVCPAGLIFDPNDEKSTKLCLCVRDRQDSCKTVNIVAAGVGTSMPWSQAIDKAEYNAQVEAAEGEFRGWVKVRRDVDFAYYDAQGMAGTELTGDWNLTFKVALDSGNPSGYTLCENSHDQWACSASLRIRVIGSSVRADVRRKDGATVTVQLDNMNLGVRQAVTLMLERQGDTLTLRAKINTNPSQPPEYSQSQGGLGSGPLAATRCGLVFGKDFTGWIESVLLVLNQCNN